MLFLFSCGSCPRGYTGNGQHCERINGCEPNPCYPNVLCHQMNVPPYYRCGSCPAGYSGNGVSCSREDECDLAKPCWPGVKCYKLPLGYRWVQLRYFSYSCREKNIDHQEVLLKRINYKQVCFSIKKCILYIGIYIWKTWKIAKGQ